MSVGLLGDEELAAVGVRAGVGHGQPSRHIEIQVRIELVFKRVAGIACAGARRIAALNHELRNHAMESRSVVERLVVHLLLGLRIGPVLGALGEAR